MLSRLLLCLALLVPTAAHAQQFDHQPAVHTDAGNPVLALDAPALPVHVWQTQATTALRDNGLVLAQYQAPAPLPQVQPLPSSQLQPVTDQSAANLPPQVQPLPSSQYQPASPPQWSQQAPPLQQYQVQGLPSSQWQTPACQPPSTDQLSMSHMIALVGVVVANAVLDSVRYKLGIASAKSPAATPPPLT